MTSTLVDAHLRAAMSVPDVEMRMAVIVVVHPDRDPEEAADRRYDHNVAAHPDRTAPRSITRAVAAAHPPPTSPAPPRRVRASIRASVQRAPPRPAGPAEAQSFRAERL